MSIGKLIHVAVAGPAAVRLLWDDGHVACIDLSGAIAAHPALRPLSDPATFAQVAVSDLGWSIEWPGELDFGSRQLRRWGDEQAGETMAPAAFRAWVDAHGFTLDRAAQALGLSRRIVSYYLSGEQPVPKTVMLATEGFDHRAAA